LQNQYYIKDDGGGGGSVVVGGGPYLSLMEDFPNAPKFNISMVMVVVVVLSPLPNSKAKYFPMHHHMWSGEDWL